MTTVFLPTDRPVRMHISLDGATRDRHDRGDCILMDLHGLWWSVPMELNLHQIHHAITTELEQHDLRSFPSHLGDVYRPQVA